MELAASDRPSFLGRKDRARVCAAYLEPGPQRLGLLSHEVMVSRVGTLEAADEYPVGAGIVIAHLQESYFAGAQAGVVGNAEDGAIAGIGDGPEQTLNLFELQK